jgi:hypothetical protein
MWLPRSRWDLRTALQISQSKVLGEVSAGTWHRPLDDWPRPPLGLLSRAHEATAV